MSTPTPAPALTGEQIEGLTTELRGMFRLSTVPEDDDGADLAFDTWYAAVIAQAKREALRDVKQAVEDGFPPYGSELRFDGSEDRELAAYGSGMRDALSLALGTGGRI